MEVRGAESPRGRGDNEFFARLRQAFVGNGCDLDHRILDVRAKGALSIGGTGAIAAVR